MDAKRSLDLPKSDVLTAEQLSAPIEALHLVDPADRVARASLIHEHCSVCRVRWDWPELERAAECFGRRCTLSDPANLASERALLLQALEDLRDPNNADDALVDAFNEHIASCGVLTIGLGNRSDGFRRIAYEGSTLRAVLQRSVVLLLAWFAGERIHLNINVGTQGQIEERVREVHRHARDTQAQARRQEDEARVVRLHDDGKSVRSIARQMGWGEDRGRVNAILQRHGRKEKGERYTSSP